MPIIAVEEDHGEATRLLHDAGFLVDEKSNSVLSLKSHGNKNDRNEDTLGSTQKSKYQHENQKFILQPQKNSIRHDVTGDSLAILPSNQLDLSAGSTFELCSIGSCANLSEYNTNDSLDTSCLRSSRHSSSKARDFLNSSLGRSGRSIRHSSQSRNSVQSKYIIIKAPSSSQLSMSIGKSNRGNNLDGSISRQPSQSNQIADIVVIPKQESIDTKYFVDYSSEIGRGTKTIVRKCVERGTGNRYAVKSVKRSDKTEYEHMRKEASLLTALNHPSIIQIYDTFEDDKYLHMVVEICKGGEIYDRVVQPPRKSRKETGPHNRVLNCKSEKIAAVIVLSVVSAIVYLHDHNIVHRDLKLENLLFKFKPKDKNQQSLTDIRVIDFGLSRRYDTHHRFASLTKLDSFVGTKFYVAPEVLNQSYTHAVDIWSIGVLAYALMSAKAPFTGRNDQELFDKIQHCSEELRFPSPDFDDVSDVAKHFIRSILVKDPTSRPTACELLEHPWMMKASKWKIEIDAEAAVRGHTKGSVFQKLIRAFGKTKNQSNTKLRRIPSKNKASDRSDLDCVTHKSLEVTTQKSLEEP